MNGTALVESARTLIGIPYRHQGRTRHGLDCLGALLMAGDQIGVVPVDIGRTNYGRAPLAELIERIGEYCDPLEAPEAGAIVAIRWPGDKRAGHVGILTGVNIIHSYSMAGRVVEHGYRGPWLKWTASIWWLRGLDHG